VLSVFIVGTAASIGHHLVHRNKFHPVAFQQRGNLGATLPPISVMNVFPRLWDSAKTGLVGRLPQRVPLGKQGPWDTLSPKIASTPCIVIVSTYIAAHSYLALLGRVSQWLQATFTRWDQLGVNNRRSHFMTVSINNAGVSGNADITPLDVGDAVRRFREASGYSVEDLALTCGLTDVEISRIETGEDLDPGRVKRIAAALQMPASAFDSL
jgi:hypothetical protein